MMFDNDLQVLQIELSGDDLASLQDRLLNGVVGNNRPVDWVHLLLKIQK